MPELREAGSGLHLKDSFRLVGGDAGGLDRTECLILHGLGFAKDQAQPRSHSRTRRYSTRGGSLTRDRKFCSSFSIRRSAGFCSYTL